MAHKLVLRASQKYRDSLKAIESEAKAPRKIIVWLIALEVIEIAMVSCLFYEYFLKKFIGG